MEAKLSGWTRNSLIGQAGAPLSSHLHKTHLLSSMLFFNIPNQGSSWPLKLGTKYANLNVRF